MDDQAKLKHDVFQLLLEKVSKLDEQITPETSAGTLHALLVNAIADCVAEYSADFRESV